MLQRLFALASAGLLLSASAFAGELGIGDAAPPLEIDKWVKGEAVPSFEKGHTYVVEFWATWCGPCRRSIPHLTELQKKYADEVTIIGVSVRERDPRKVVPYVQKMGQQMEYTVATDLIPAGRTPREGAMSMNWMAAAGKSGIPVAFIVNGDGRIAWIGHPTRLDDPLAQVVAGTWKLDTAARDAQAEVRSRAAYEKGRKKLAEALEKKNWKEVVGVVDRMIESNPEAEAELGPQKFKALLQLNAYDDAYAYANKYVMGPAKDSARALNFIAWTIVDPETRVAKKDLALALQAARRANELTRHERPEMLDTFALVLFEMGERKKAFEIQERAVKLAKDTMFEKELTERLERYRKAVGSGGHFGIPAAAF